MVIDTVLHAGTEHPNLWWVFIPSLLSFIFGVGVGLYSDQLRRLTQSDPDISTE